MKKTKGHHSIPCFVHLISLTLPSLPPSYQDACDNIVSIWITQKHIHISKFLI